jgi:hypothetical protein
MRRLFDFIMYGILVFSFFLWLWAWSYSVGLSDTKPILLRGIL